jgi:hypothetical protein
MADPFERSSLPKDLVQAYEETLFEVHLPEGPVVFSASSGPRSTPKSAFAQTLTVVTAYNPGLERPRDKWEHGPHRLRP